MSLILNNETNQQWTMYEDPVDDPRDAAMLDRYLAIMEANRKASRFVPDDALLALDMAGFVRGQIDNSRKRQPVSAARMALALVQPHNQTILQ